MAQDPAQLAPDIYTVLLENDRVRVSDIKFAPGKKIGLHSHPDHVLYVMSPGKLKLSYPDGTGKELEVQTGQALWSGAETHESENVGNTELRALLVELKS